MSEGNKPPDRAGVYAERGKITTSDSRDVKQVHPAMDAERLRAQIPSSTDPARLERMAQDDERRRLAIFASWVIRSAWTGDEIELGEIQDKAEQLGLIVPVEGGYDPERHGEDDFAEPGDPYFELAAWLKGLDRGKATGS